MIKRVHFILTPLWEEVKYINIVKLLLVCRIRQIKIKLKVVKTNSKRRTRHGVVLFHELHSKSFCV